MQIKKKTSISIETMKQGGYLLPNPQDIVLFKEDEFGDGIDVKLGSQIIHISVKDLYKAAVLLGGGNPVNNYCDER